MYICIYILNIYIFIYVYIYIGRAIFQNALSTSPKIDVAMPSSEIKFWKRPLHKYKHIGAYIHICEKLFIKTQSLNLALNLALQVHFLEWRLTRSGKRSSYIAALIPKDGNYKMPSSLTRPACRLSSRCWWWEVTMEKCDRYITCTYTPLTAVPSPAQ